ncbi:S41 family peptidase, partial [Flavobacterium sp.]
YTIAILKQGTGYIGFILDGGNTVWQKNQIKLRLDTDGKKMGGVYYLRNYSEYKLDDVKMIGNNTISLGGFTLKRDDPKLQDTPQVKSYLELINTNGPIMQQYSDKTLVLRIPSFDGSNKKAIDSVIAANSDKILKTKNLVVDIRYNGGGSDGSYAEIIPFLYTNPIRVVATQFLSTPLNNARMQEYLAEEGISEEEKTEVNVMIKRLNDNMGGYVGWNDETVYVQKLDTVHPFPKNVAILINQGNGSTSEQFLLAAKQSSKTKLFGTTTAGVLDISNMHSVTSPCGIILRYCLSRSLRIPDMAIDDKGIQPDYYLDAEIPQHQWVQYAEDSFEK